MRLKCSRSSFRKIIIYKTAVYSALFDVYKNRNIMWLAHNITTLIGTPNLTQVLDHFSVTKTCEILISVGRQLLLLLK